MVGVAAECHRSALGAMIANPRRPIWRTRAHSASDRAAASSAALRTDVSMIVESSTRAIMRPDPYYLRRRVKITDLSALLLRLTKLEIQPRKM
jgi:hypothetical protein